MRDHEQAQGRVDGGTVAPFPLETVRIGMDGPISVVDLSNLPDAPAGIRLEVVVDRRGASPQMPAPGQAIPIGSLARRDGGWERLNPQGRPATRDDLISHV